MAEEALAYMREHHFKEDLGELEPSTRQVLEQYSGIPPAEVMKHVYDVRERAFAVYPYPCIGMGRFLQLALGQHPLYPEVLARMKEQEQTYLDLGCAFAQDIRRLVADGVDSARCYGSDLRLEFIDLGYELFRDRDTLKSKFYPGDIFDPASPVHGLNGQMDIIGANSFFHLFDRDQQKQCAIATAKLLKPKENSLIVGRQVGSRDPANVPRRFIGGLRFRHNEQTWQQLWKEVGDETGVRYEVKAVESGLTNEEGQFFMQYSVRRLS